MSIKERIEQYANIKGISIYKLEKRLGISRSYFMNTAKVSVEVVVKFLSVFVDVSPEWLLTGSGDMLKKPPVQDASIPSERIGTERSFLEKEAFYLKLIGKRTDDLIKAEEIIEDLKEEIEHLKKQIKIFD